MMIIVGLTGGIACGKSFVSSCFKELDVPVFDADEAVHKLLAQGGEAVEAVGEKFPDAIIDGAINREIMGVLAFSDPHALTTLEMIIHPLAGKKRDEFIQNAKANKEPVIVLDIPLLFETGANELCNHILVVELPKELQMERALAREIHDKETLEQIMEAQGNLEEKAAKADTVIDNSGTKEATRQRVQDLVNKLKAH